MDEILVALAVAALFLIRIGVPVAILIVLGILIDRWQSNTHHRAGR